MAEMTGTRDARKYITIVTDRGKEKIAAAALVGQKVNIVTAAVGDGGGAYYMPTPDQNELRGEKWRGDIATKRINEDSPNMIDVKVVVPRDVGGFTVREMGIFDDEGDLIAVCNTPDTEKAIILEGIAATLSLIMHIVVVDATVLEFKIDPTLDPVSQEDFLDFKDEMKGKTSITKKGSPTAETVGTLGQHYFDEDTGLEYICKEITEDGAYIWEKVGHILVDDADGKTLFRLGMENGKLYIEDVEEE